MSTYQLKDKSQSASEHKAASLVQSIYQIRETSEHELLQINNVYTS